jgi:pimeloyl-ACP methyl ester carboxylesterase
MSARTTTGTVVTEGADIYFECRGSGPGLLLISGGGGDAGNYSEIADSLADEYTVLTYDRRGNSRSPLRTAPTKLRVEEQSADALAVLEHNGMSSASVFGSSSGAVIGLDLAARSPHAVELLVAHEPPVISVLDDSEQWVTFFDELDRIVEEQGVGPALMKFMSSVGHAENEPQQLSSCSAWRATGSSSPATRCARWPNSFPTSRRYGRARCRLSSREVTKAGRTTTAGPQRSSLLALAWTSSSSLATTWPIWTMRTALCRSCGKS